MSDVFHEQNANANSIALSQKIGVFSLAVLVRTEAAPHHWRGSILSHDTAMLLGSPQKVL